MPNCLNVAEISILFGGNTAIPKHVTQCQAKIGIAGSTPVTCYKYKRTNRLG